MNRFIDNHKYFINKIIMYVSIILFIVLTILNLLPHFPWHDESYAWILAQEMNFNNVLQILHVEGHFIIWYLLLLPFAKLNFHYPYPMFIINWLSFFIAIIILWKKAPFNNILKIIITFSWISLNYFPIIARCYSIGILGLFIIATMYTKQLKKPILYSLILILTAHTSFLATIPVIYLSIIFVYNLYKNRTSLSAKNIIYPIIILLLGIFLWFLPFFNGYGHENSKAIYLDPQFFMVILNFFNTNNHYYMLWCYLIVFIFILIFADNKIRFASLLSITTFVLFFSFIYQTFPHNCIFLIVYLILFLWLTPKLHNINIKTVLFLILFSILLFWNHTYHMWYALKIKTPESSILQSINKQTTKSYILLSTEDDNLLPYFNNYNYIYYDVDYNGILNVNYLTNFIKDFMDKCPAEIIYVISHFKINNDSKEVCICYKNNVYITIFNKSFLN